MYERLWTEFGLAIGFIDHLYTQLVTTLHSSRYTYTSVLSLLQSPLVVFR
jgi:hypothetical protein